MPIVVSDTSPIRALKHLQLLHLLDKQFDGVLIPPAVAQELRRGSRSLPPINMAELPGIMLSDPIDATAIMRDEPEIDQGEAEAISLALKEQIGTILIDEAYGRAAATKRHLRTVGVLGVLIEQKKHDHTFAVRPLMDRLRSEIQFFINDRLYQQVCQLTGE